MKKKRKNSFYSKFYTNYDKEGNKINDFEHLGAISILLPVIDLYEPKLTRKLKGCKIPQLTTNTTIL